MLKVSEMTELVATAVVGCVDNRGGGLYAL